MDSPKTELGFRSHLGFWIANDEATWSGLWVERPRFSAYWQEVATGANFALGAMDISAFMRHYFLPRAESPSSAYPWLEFGLGTLDYIRLGASFNEQEASYYDPLIDTSYLQVGEFNFELDLDLGLSYFVFENLSLDGRMNIASWNEKSVWNSSGFWGNNPPGDSKFNYLFDGTDPEISIFFSVWF
ncbi:MAG: hypothetical protein QGH51_02225 [Planctomycetota bacterium]|nr:hypothetical protein [Planctomycetota bacterium]MDP6940819.1 hypothetical protein [Planctomycetota bacterium]